MSVGFRLYREVRDFAPAIWSQSEYIVALLIADDANDQTRQSFIANPLLCMRTRLSERGLRQALHGLAASGYEFRVCHGYGKDGRPVFAAKSHAVDYRVPDMLKGGVSVPPIDGGKGGVTVPPIEPKAARSGRKGGTGRSKGGTTTPPLSSISSVSTSITDVHVVTPSVEGSACAPSLMNGDFDWWHRDA